MLINELDLIDKLKCVSIAQKCIEIYCLVYYLVLQLYFKYMISQWQKINTFSDRRYDKHIDRNECQLPKKLRSIVLSTSLYCIMQMLWLLLTYYATEPCWLKYQPDRYLNWKNELYLNHDYKIVVSLCFIYINSLLEKPLWIIWIPLYITYHFGLLCWNVYFLLIWQKDLW